MARDYEALVLNSTADALVATSADDVVRFWNNGATELFGYTREEAVGSPLVELTVPGNRLQDERALLAQAERSGTATAETVRHRKDGSLLYLNVTIRALRDGGGALEGFVRTETDVTRFRLLRESRLIESRYRDLLESMPDAILILNDTGRILLINARGEAVFGHTRDQLTETGRRYLLTCIESAKRMGQMVDDLLAFSRLGRQAPSVGPVDMAALIREVWEEEIRAGGSNARLRGLATSNTRSATTA